MRALGPALLFCPADRPDRYAKASALADAVILDLEDAVRPDRKDAARAALVDHQLDPARTVVRINPASSQHHPADLTALRKTSYNVVMLSKAESAADVVSLDAWSVIALCETPRGVLAAAELAAASNAVGLMWGAEDLIATIGGTSSRLADGRYADIARLAGSTVLLAAAAADKPAIDAVYLAIDDLVGLRQEANVAAAAGFAAKACVHPRQVPIVQRAYQPTTTELEWARQVADAIDDGGVTEIDGRMIDAPLLRQADVILSRARTNPARGPLFP